MSYEAGKGDTRRPTDHSAYSANFDAIFNRDKVRGYTYHTVILDELQDILGYGVIGNTTDFDSAVLGSNPGTPAKTENTDLNQSVE